MNLYAFNLACSYGGGLIVIAAQSEERAIEVFETIEGYHSQDKDELQEIADTLLRGHDGYLFRGDREAPLCIGKAPATQLEGCVACGGHFE